MRTWKNLSTFAVALLLSGCSGDQVINPAEGLRSPSFGMGQPKVDICHLDTDVQAWKLLSVGQPAANKHLARHDDALPGGTTPISGTPLDETCVVPVNSPPDAVDDAFETDEDTPVMDNVLANDVDPDNDPLTVTEVNGVAANVGFQIVLASGALLMVQSDGSFTYDPNAQFESLGGGETATDGFDYTVADDKGASGTASVEITINGINDPPL